MKIIIVLLVALFLIAGASAGSDSNQSEETSDARDCWLQCGNHLPCNSSQDNNTSETHHHNHYAHWVDDQVNQWSADDSCIGHDHPHHGDRDDWI